MLVAALAIIYLACCALLLSVYLQDRANTAKARHRREGKHGLEFQTHH